MSLISSFFIDPVVRAGRRFSGAGAAAVPSAAGDAAVLPLSHANPDPSSVMPATTPEAEAAGEGDEEAGEGDDGAIMATATAPMAIPVDAASMSSNPSRALDDGLRRLALDPPVSSAPAASPSPATPAAQNAAMSESLPADDGFTHLRARIHEIRALDVPEHERAHRIHGLMIERYTHMRPTSPSSFVSHDRPFTPNSAPSVFSDARPSSPLSAASDVDADNPYRLRPGDARPTYRTLEHHDDDDDDEDHADDEPVLGCQHYRRNVKVQCYECRHWYTCRHCHDAVEDHALNRKATQNMLCMACGTPQPAADTCANCATEAACYYCDICKLWDNNPRKKIYHCPDCGICRRGAGLGKDYTHCQVSLREPDTGPFLTQHRDATSALPYPMQTPTCAYRVPPTRAVPYAPTTSSPRPQPSSRCRAGTTCTCNATHCTWKRHTSVLSARRVPSRWTCNGAS